ncbi:uncharacterized protein ARMOST_17775 [Armillaria ostoyae]|uniref:Uncharacterized protein n=1 Tax=Armillaria ostoyae TaxID=47428 RepID=A0A284RZY2_ARMOS|nr:uncharacterized protein ARMOST_17775 [Armillaria ostoyae]
MRALGTARNGGHIASPLYHDYLDLKKKHGAEAAKQIIQFRLSHLDELISVAEEEGMTEESQCRKVDTYEAAIWRSCQVRRVDEARWMGRRECSSWRRAGSSRRRAARRKYLRNPSLLPCHPPPLIVRSTTQESRFLTPCRASPAASRRSAM